MLRAVIVILVLILGGSLGGAAGAQPVVCAPQTADELPHFRVWMKTLGDDWLVKARAEEARRIGDNPSVFRHLDRLYLALDDDKLATLVDCPFDKSAMYYSYERYDETGSFYVIDKGEYEDFYYVLVAKKDGSVSPAFSLPIWSPDKRHFVHGRCQAMNGPNAMWIVGIAEGIPRAEGTFELPCDTDCEIKWDDASSVTATCPGFSGFKTVRVKLQGTAWSVVP